MSTAGRVDYRVRAAKQIERRMIGETLGLLNRLNNLNKFQYIGMGSISFVDFALVHKALGINAMFSIEKPEYVERVRHNVPYACIEVLEGESHEILPEMDLRRPTIAWLDYDGLISDSILADVGLCAQRMTLGSVLLVTLNAESGSTKEEHEATAANLKRSLKKKLLPAGFTLDALQRAHYPAFLRDLCIREIAAQVHERNLLLKPHEKVIVRQFVNFDYKDGHRMCTLGWMIDAVEETRSLVKRCGLDEMPWSREGQEQFKIRPPVLTPLEVRGLNAQLPAKDLKKVVSPGVSAADIKRFSALYRHFPMYYEVVEV